MVEGAPTAMSSNENRENAATDACSASAAEVHFSTKAACVDRLGWRSRTDDDEDDAVHHSL
jgi:hypothetical protein